MTYPPPGAGAASDRASHGGPFRLMLRFAVLDERGPVADLPLRHAHLLGADDVAVPADINYADGLINCVKKSSDASSLALLYDAGDCGALVLRTCLLPQRQRPYLLSLELARHRIMLFLNKLEEWFLCDLPADEPAMTLFEQARARFTAALAAERATDHSFTPEEDRLAREALCLAIQASERLALLATDVLMTHRINAAQAAAGSGGVNLMIGCAVRREQMSEGLQKVVSEYFDFMVSPMRWPVLEPDEGEYAFSKTDKWIEWAVRTARMPVHAGPIIDLRPGRTPEWLHIWENDYDTLREVVFQHLKKVVTRYHKAVSRWTVASGLHLNADFKLTLEQIMDLSRLCVMLVRKMIPNAKIQIEIDQPFGEHYGCDPFSLPPLIYAEMLTQQGIAIDAIALRIQMGDAREGRAARDLMALSAMLDSYSVFEKPIVVTALGAPSEPIAPAPGAEHERFEPGRWRKPWSPDAQAEWLHNALAVCISKPYVLSVAWQDLYDSAGPAELYEMQNGGLITAAGKPKPALRQLAKATRVAHFRQHLAPRHPRVDTAALVP